MMARSLPDTIGLLTHRWSSITWRRRIIRAWARGRVAYRRGVENHWRNIPYHGNYEAPLNRAWRWGWQWAHGVYLVSLTRSKGPTDELR